MGSKSDARLVKDAVRIPEAVLLVGDARKSGRYQVGE